MNIFIRELKANLKSLFIWSFVITLFILIGTAKFSSFADNPEMLAIFDSMPKALIDAVNISAFNLTTVSGFFGMMFSYLALMGAMAAAMWGSDVISKEERDKTVEFSLVLPVTRNRVLSAKGLSAFVYCVFFVLITWVVSLLTVKPYTPDEQFYSFLGLEMVALLLIEMVFLALGLLLGSSLKNYKRAGSTAVGIILGAYFMAMAVDISDDLKFLRFITPFKYYDAARLFSSGRIEWISLGLTSLIMITSMFAAYRIFNKRDLMI